MQRCCYIFVQVPCGSYSVFQRWTIIDIKFTEEWRITILELYSLIVSWSVVGLFIVVEMASVWI